MYSYETYYGACDGIYIDFDILHIGGPVFCRGDFPSNYTADDTTSLRIDIVLCGVPQPEVHADFIDQTLKVVNTTINSYTHNYMVQLPRLTQAKCGKELTVTATGQNRTLTDKTKIFVKNCKYDSYVHLSFTLGHF